MSALLSRANGNVAGKHNLMVNLLNEKYLRGKLVLLLFVITSCVYAFMLLVTIPHVMKFGNGMPLLDMMPLGYSYEYVTTLLESLGAGGRSAYLTKQIPADMFYPGLFGITYTLVFGYFLNKSGKLTTHWSVISYFPLLASACDYIENFFFIHMLANYPVISEGTINIASVFSIAKSGTTTLYFVCLTVLVVYFIIKKVNRQRE